MPTTIESLELTEERRRLAREEIQRMAYFAWERAGRPDGSHDGFWREAEGEWIQFHYVPDRSLHGGHDLTAASREDSTANSPTSSMAEAQA